MIPRAVLAAIDFSDTSQTALILAARLARHCGAALHVLHAEDVLLAAAARKAGVDLLSETTEEMERFIADAWPAGEGAPRRHVVAGPPVDVILDVARREQADMVVVGSRGMSGAARLVFGSIAEGLLRRADQPVLVAPPGWMPARPDLPDLTGTGPVIAAVDFSPSSLRSAAAGCELARALGASFELAHVVPELPVMARWRPTAERALDEAVAAAQEELARVAKDLPCASALPMRVERGTVPDRLAEMALPGGTRAPVLVLGRQSGTTGAPPGRTAYRVLTLAKVPVLMHAEG